MRTFFLNITFISLVCATSVHADQDEALNAAFADTATTAISLASGLVEMNPLGAVGSVVIKIATIAYIKDLPQVDQAKPYSFMSSLWGGASANNLCWLTAAGPACFLVGAAAGLLIWNKASDERNYWADCKLKRFTDSSLKCEWKKIALLKPSRSVQQFSHETNEFVDRRWKKTVKQISSPAVYKFSPGTQEYLHGS